MEKLINQIIAEPASIIATAALLVSIISLYVSIVTIRQTRKHNRLSVKPICYVFPPDFEDWVAVVIQNKGVGPLITKSTKFYDENNNIKKYLIDLMPTLPDGYYWSNFTKNDHFVLAPNDEKILIELKCNENDKTFQETRDLIRKKLSQITMEYEFTDIYGQKFPTIIHSLTWFGRSKTVQVID